MKIKVLVERWDEWATHSTSYYLAFAVPWWNESNFLYEIAMVWDGHRQWNKHYTNFYFFKENIFKYIWRNVLTKKRDKWWKWCSKYKKKETLQTRWKNSKLVIKIQVETYSEILLPNRLLEESSARLASWLILTVQIQTKLSLFRKTIVYNVYCISLIFVTYKLFKIFNSEHILYLKFFLFPK